MQSSAFVLPICLQARDGLVRIEMHRTAPEHELENVQSTLSNGSLAAAFESEICSPGRVVHMSERPVGGAVEFVSRYWCSGQLVRVASN